MTKQELSYGILLHYRKGIIILAHFFVIIFSFLVSTLLRFEFSIPNDELPGFYITLLCLVTVKPIVFWFFGLYRGFWIYASIDDLWKIIKANVLASAILILSVSIVGRYGFPRSVFIIDFILCTSLVGGLRFVSRLLKEGYYHNHDLHSKKVLIVGAGDTGIMLLREYRKNPSMGRVIGFMDDNRMKLNESIHGLKILGSRKDVPKVVEKYEIDEIVIAMPLVRGDGMREILSYCEKTKAKIKIAPQLNKILSGKLVKTCLAGRR
jgi:FlaA1/EpsC-like NDP-sugar epimerase